MFNMTQEQIERFWSKVDKREYNECWLWNAAKSKRGYGQLTVNRKYMAAHRVSFWMGKGYFPDEVCHSCDNPQCVNPNHLWAGTHSDNMKDMVYKNRNAFPMTKGSKNGSSKLQENEVKRIRELYKTGNYNQAEIGKMFGVSYAMISLIVRNKKWKHIS